MTVHHETTGDEPSSSSLKKPTAKVWSKVAAVLIGLLIIVVLIWGPVELAETLIAWWQSETGVLGALGYAAFYVVATTSFVPAAVLGVGAGFLFGGVWGTGIALLCRPLGALVSFFVGRHLAREHVQHWIEDWPKFEAINRMTLREPFRIVLLLRLVPVLTFNITSYVFGLTKVTWKQFFGATFIGVLPGSLFYVYLGVAAGDVTRAVALEDAPPLEDYLVTWIVGIVAFVIVLAYLAYRGRKYWLEIVEDDNVEENHRRIDTGD